jgi:SAM-dependent methyltransferase
MASADPPPPVVGFDFYGAQYARFASPLAAQMRREVYGEDIGQQGWRTLAEQAEIVELLGLGPDDRVLDVACGAGGPSLALVERTRSELLGLDSEPAAIAHAESQARSRGLSDRARFSVLDCSGPLPLGDGRFDALLCIDAICHLPDRAATLAEWARLLRAGGRLLFTDPAVLTGAMSRSEMDARASAGPFLVVPPGLNEKALESARLDLRRSEDHSAAMAEIASLWHATRLRHAAALEQEEGAPWFAQRQLFLSMTAQLASTRRLSRFLYLAEKRASD